MQQYNENALKVAISQLTEEQARLFACDCADRILAFWVEYGAPVEAQALESVTVARRFAIGEATAAELDAAREEAYWSAYHFAAVCWEPSEHVYYATLDVFRAVAKTDSREGAVIAMVADIKAAIHAARYAIYQEHRLFLEDPTAFASTETFGRWSQDRHSEVAREAREATVRWQGVRIAEYLREQ
ncbi:MAG: hypothetical protein ABIJ72_03530 [bacterium]